ACRAGPPRRSASGPQPAPARSAPAAAAHQQAAAPRRSDPDPLSRLSLVSPYLSGVTPLKLQSLIMVGSAASATMRRRQPMAVVVTVAKGYDLDYVWKNQG